MMKKRIGNLCLSLVLCFGLAFGVMSVTALADESGVALTAENFEDAAFLEYVKTEFDQDGDGVLRSYEINSVTSISCSGQEISSLKGIEYFTALKSLYCYSNNLSSLDVSQNA